MGRSDQKSGTRGRNLAQALSERTGTVVHLTHNDLDAVGGDAIHRRKYGDVFTIWCSVGRFLSLLDAVAGSPGAGATSSAYPLFEEGDSVGRIIETLRCRREVSHVTCRMQPSHGGMRWFSFSCRVMTGEPYAGMMLIRFRDVTPERDEAARSVLDTAAQVRPELIYASIGEMLPYGIWICELDGTALYVSASFLNLAGTTLEECRRTRG